MLEAKISKDGCVGLVVYKAEKTTEEQSGHYTRSLMKTKSDVDYNLPGEIWSGETLNVWI